MPNGGGHISCRLCKWSQRETLLRELSFDTYCDKHEMRIIGAGESFCADLAMPEPPGFLAEENILPDNLYIWSEATYYGMYYSDIILLASFADYKAMPRDEIIHKVRAINNAKQAEFNAKQKQNEENEKNKKKDKDKD